MDRFGLYKGFGPVDMGLLGVEGVGGGNFGVLWRIWMQFFPGLIREEFMGEGLV